jgi:alpha-tubulin suppressor-like RCC1 family protein
VREMTPNVGRSLRRAIGIVALLLLPVVGIPAVAQAAVPGIPWAWGDNALGQLANGTTTHRLAAGPIASLTDITSIAGGRGHGIALTSGGAVWTWGSNDYGEIGDGTQVNRLSPFAVSGLGTVTAIAAGHYHSLALRSDGTVRAWGINGSGQLGDGTTTQRRTPVAVSGLTNVIAIAGGRDLSLALKSDGTVWAWGLNNEGELGDGTTTNRSTPVQVSGLTGAVAIAAGRDHGLAIRSDGTVWAWGENIYGQLGDGTTTNRSTPVQVSGLTGATMISAGAHHSVALRSDGTVRSWGRNQLGQTGDGTKVTPRQTPVTVQGLTNVVSIGTGRDFGLAVRADGTAWSWGSNDLGQLGDGTTTNRLAPVQVPGVANAREIGGGRDWAMALVASGPDTTPPTTPGTPIEQGTTSTSISLSWAASSDASPITYRVYRDGATSFVGSTAATTYTDSGLTSGTTHTYSVDAIDSANNVSAKSGISLPITVPTPDTMAPTTPGQPTGTSNSSTTIDLTWAASQDDRSTTITYVVRRDGAQLAPITSASTTTVSFQDTGLTPGSTHTYTVQAIDGATNPSAQSAPSLPIVVQSGPTSIFADGFSSGNFSLWTSVTGLTIDPASGNPTAPSARAQVSAASAFAARNLGGTYGSVCMSVRVNATSLGTQVLTLLRLRTAANGNVMRVYTDTSGVLFVKSDVSGTQKWSGVALGTGAWHTLELCGTVGASAPWDLYRDGTRIVSAWVANTGTTPVGRIEIGDASAKTFTANFDDVVVDQTPG